MDITAVDYRRTAWAVYPGTLARIAAHLRRSEGFSAELAEPEAATLAARARQPRTTGGVAVISLKGLITPEPSYLSLLFGGGGGLKAFRSSLREAVGDDDIAAIVLDIDSPGGSTDLIAETAADIRAAREAKPIVAVANTWAASAAYWLAAQADELVVTPSGEIGSIGVFTIHEDWSKANEDFGVTPTYVSAGKYKTEGNPDEPLSDEARDAMQATVDEFYGLFVADVAKGRAATPAGVRSGYGEGRMVTARQGIELKMADRIESLEGTIARVVRSPSRARNRAEVAAINGAPPALTEASEGSPESNPPDEGGEETRVRPSGSYIDLMFDAP